MKKSLFLAVAALLLCAPLTEAAPTKPEKKFWSRDTFSFWPFKKETAQQKRVKEKKKKQKVRAKAAKKAAKQPRYKP
jgi:hypothetical protein